MDRGMRGCIKEGNIGGEGRGGKRREGEGREEKGGGRGEWLNSMCQVDLTATRLKYSALSSNVTYQ